MINSILNSTKKQLGIAEDYQAFDADIITLINSTFSTLHQLGIGPSNGFMIEDDETTWDSYLLGDVRINSVKTYVYLKVRVLFDPPTSSFVLTSMEKQIAELEWRLNVVYENDLRGSSIDGGVLPLPPSGIFDGGRP